MCERRESVERLNMEQMTMSTARTRLIGEMKSPSKCVNSEIGCSCECTAVVSARKWSVGVDRRCAVLSHDIATEWSPSPVICIHSEKQFRNFYADL